MCAVSTLNLENSETQTTYHHGNLRESLLINALELLESTQSTDFSLRELTRMTGVSANAAYRHFANKEKLLTALAAHGFEQMSLLQASAVNAANTPREGFLQAGRAYIAFATQHPALFRLMFGRFAITHRDDTLNAAAQLSYNGMLYSAAAAFGVDVEDTDMKTIAATAWSVVHGLSHLIIDGQFEGLTNNLDHLINQVLQRSIAGHGQ